ncbi:MAG: hypothetical protein ACJ8GO_12910 [Ramlibacter sp.]
MPRDDPNASRDPENRRPASAATRAARSAAWGGQRRGRSGYGMESIRPHLRAQLEQQKLLRPTFPPEADPDDAPNDAER